MESQNPSNKREVTIDPLDKRKGASRGTLGSLEIIFTIVKCVNYSPINIIHFFIFSLDCYHIKYVSLSLFYNLSGNRIFVFVFFRQNRREHNRSNRILHTIFMQYNIISQYSIMDNIFKNINHWGDILAIPFFLLLAIYLYKIPNRTNIENLLFFFSIVGFFADILFTYIRYFLRKPTK